MELGTFPRYADCGVTQEGETVRDVTIYQFRLYEAANDEMRKSRRWATREKIEWLHGEILEFVGSEIFGMTERDFDPHIMTHCVSVR